MRLLKVGVGMIQTKQKIIVFIPFKIREIRFTIQRQFSSCNPIDPWDTIDKLPTQCSIELYFQDGYNRLGWSRHECEFHNIILINDFFINEIEWYYK